MKIIKLGKVPSFKFVCNICGCEFVASPQPNRFYSHKLIATDADGERIIAASYDCPTCGVTVSSAEYAEEDEVT